MKPYQTAFDVVQYMKKYGKRKPINIDAITEYFRAGAERELKKITGSTYDDYQQYQEVWAWNRELNSWQCCWYTWIYGLSLLIIRLTV